MSFSGRTVLVTGAGGGIGAAMVHLFARKGADVIAVDRDESSFGRLDGLEGVSKVAADLSRPRGLEAAFAAVDGRLDVLCNNAGVSNIQPLHETQLEEYHRNLAINLTAPFVLSQMALPLMLGQGHGVILNTASIAGLRGLRAGASYTAAKWGLIGLTQNVAGTYGPLGIRCCAICPGGTDTGMQAMGAGSDFALRVLNRDRERPQMQSPYAVAEAAVFLASDEASSINGAVLPVEQGMLAF